MGPDLGRLRRCCGWHLLYRLLVCRVRLGNVGLLWGALSSLRQIRWRVTCKEGPLLQQQCLSASERPFIPKAADWYGGCKGHMQPKLHN